jgi:hypothetical protein
MLDFIAAKMILYTNIPLTLYPRRGSRDISDISPRRPHFTKMRAKHKYFRRDVYDFLDTSDLFSFGVAEASQICFRDAHVLPKSLSYEEYWRRDRW